MLFTPYFLHFTPHCLAAEPETSITSDTLEYFSDGRKYVAKGSVRIEKEDAVAQADEMVYFEETGDVHAFGNVRYDDKDASMTAQNAELNMDKKTGRLFEAEILFKKDNYHLAGKEIERRGEDEFYSREPATFTTCDGIPAAWCFRGRDVNLTVGDRLTAKDASFRVRDMPILYTPALLLPVLTERQTGFLMPEISNSNTRGFGLNIPFYWAIAENMDATFIFDMYSKRGIGSGLEYRYLEPGGGKGGWWIYHIRDSELERDFIELRGLHENRPEGAAGWYLNINAVNEKDFYREFNPHKEKQIQRFLESTGEVSIPVGQDRLYLLSQYWIDLRHDTGDIPQKLPEAGYVMRYTRFGSFLVTADASAANFWRKNGLSAQRLDIYPRVLHTLGSDVVLSQIVGARGTAYIFSDERERDNGLQRTAFEYDANIHMRLYRKYDSFTHVVEPVLRYHFIASSENSIPLFDILELYKKTSRIEVGFLNRILVRDREIVSLRLVQPADTYRGDRPFRPLAFELGVRRPLPVKLGARYDVNSGEVKTVSSEIQIRFAKGTVTMGQRYNHDEDIMVYKAGIAIHPVKAIQMGVSAWYDEKGEGLSNLTATLQYASQCWGIRAQVAKKPGDVTFMVMFDLYGLTAKRPKV